LADFVLDVIDLGIPQTPRACEGEGFGPLLLFGQHGRGWPEGEELRMHIADTSESAWGDSETFGRMLSSLDILGSDRQAEALTTVAFVIGHDPRIADHLG